MIKLLLILFFLTSCSVLQFAHDDGIPISLGAKPAHKEFVKIEGVVPLYLWGIIAPPEPISLSKAFAKQGALSVSKLTISEESSFEVWWPRIITFGMYWPVRWSAEGFIQRPNRVVE